MAQSSELDDPEEDVSEDEPPDEVSLPELEPPDSDGLDGFDEEPWSFL